jgi:hypothetical protein
MGGGMVDVSKTSFEEMAIMGFTSELPAMTAKPGLFLKATT